MNEYHGKIRITDESPLIADLIEDVVGAIICGTVCVGVLYFLITLISVWE